jgi:ABC-2 type transport system permease protein
VLRGLWQLTWLEIKVFVPEPLGVIGTVVIPVVVFVVLARVIGARAANATPDVPRFMSTDLPILVAPDAAGGDLARRASNLQHGWT